MKFLSILEYAKKKGISVQAVYQKMKRGNLEFQKIGKTYLIKED
jgi:excisionase family DNA binding protein